MFHSLRSGLNLAFNQLWWYRESTSCVTFFSPPSPPLSVWHLLNLSGVYWCNNWCRHPCCRSPSSLWCSRPSPHTMNTLASRLPKQLSRWEEGKSNLMAGTRRGDCFSSQSQGSESIAPSGSDGGKEETAEKWKAAGLCRRSCWAGWTHSPSSPPISFHFFLPLALTLPISHWVTPGTTSLPPVVWMKRNNN